MGYSPYAINYSSKALGYTFLIIPIEFIYSLFIPSLEGIFLTIRLCFVTFKVIVAIVMYCVFVKRLKKNQALLLAGILLPWSGSIQAFNYNTVPIWLLLLSGCLLYDTLEQEVRHKEVELVIAGFLTAIALFANPGWGLTMIVFAILIWVRTSNTNLIRLRAVAFYAIGILIEVFIVVVPISIQTSFKDFLYGFYRLFINPMPVAPLAPGKSASTVITSFIGPTRNILIISALVFLLVYFFARRYICENGERLENKQYITQALSVSMLACIVYWESQNFLATFMGIGDAPSSYWGYTFVLYAVAFVAIGKFRKEKILWYLSIYPFIFAVAEIVLVSYQASIARFSNTFTVIIPLLYVLFREKSELTRWIATLIAGFLIIILVFSAYFYVYRDAQIQYCDYKVDSGVYKGLYTTEARANDLVQLENYLNEIIGEDEAYSFRDNVPFAYLMTHTGKVCEISTWDYMQYTYDRNSPAPVFDYYRVRNMIPDKIIYIDYGRDANVSIEDQDYRYNDWVNAYYDKVDDFAMNETFYHVIVYQYNGTFDGNYQTWIDNYYELIK